MKNLPIRTHVEISVKVLNPNGKYRANPRIAFDVDLIPAVELDAKANEMLKAAAEVVGYKIPKQEIY